MASIRIAMLGTGLIGNFYTETLHNQRATDRVTVVYSRSAERVVSLPKSGPSRRPQPISKQLSVTKTWMSWWSVCQTGCMNPP